MATHADRIVDFLRRHSGKDDDEIAQALGIQPRQTVNAECRYLESIGVLIRERGPRGKIVNRLATDAEAAPAAVLETEIEIAPRPRRPDLGTGVLVQSGFAHVANWVLDGERLALDGSVPRHKGVYAFASGDTVHYVGIAAMGLAKRMYFYARPGKSQSTNIRINELVRTELASEKVRIYTATPPDFEWNGLVVNGRAGLEVGLIETYHLPWNVRGT